MKIEIFLFHFSFSVERQTFSLEKEIPFVEATAKSLTNSREREKKKKTSKQYYISCYENYNEKTLIKVQNKLGQTFYWKVKFEISFSLAVLLDLELEIQVPHYYLSHLTFHLYATFSVWLLRKIDKKRGIK